jgi:hypothetical protein
MTPLIEKAPALTEAKTNEVHGQANSVQPLQSCLLRELLEFLAFLALGLYLILHGI